jgi:flavin-dependent dehydrogenase
MVLPCAEPTKSYWIEAAGSSLRHYGATEPLPEETDVAIIGSGYAGASTAYWLHKVRETRQPRNPKPILNDYQGTEGSSKQPKVTILEARDICGSATGRNGREITRLQPCVFDKKQEDN